MIVRVDNLQTNWKLITEMAATGHAIIIILSALEENPPIKLTQNTAVIMHLSPTPPNSTRLLPTLYIVHDEDGTILDSV